LAPGGGEVDRGASKRVLIVDDNASNRLLLKLQTERWGMRAPGYKLSRRGT